MRMRTSKMPYYTRLFRRKRTFSVEVNKNSDLNRTPYLSRRHLLVGRDRTAKKRIGNAHSPNADYYRNGSMTKVYFSIF